ncbi:MAG: TonB-dependent receptor [Pseudomonadota bacterium]
MAVIQYAETGLLRRRDRFSVLACALMSVPIATGSLAQDAGIGDPDTVVLDTIIISNRNWREDVQRIPGGITVISEEDIEKASSRDLSIVERNSPNTVFQSSNSDTRLVVRGIVNFPNALSDPLGISINDVSLPLGSIQTPYLVNAESLFLFKGAQGAHFGRNSEAGLLRIESAEPGARDRTWFEAGFDLFDARDPEPAYAGLIGFSQRLSNVFAVTSALEVAVTDGYISNPIARLENGGELERVSWQGGVKASVSENTDIRFDSVYQKTDGGKEQFRFLTGPFSTSRFVSNYNDRSDERRTSAIQSLRLFHRFDGFDLTAISGFTNFQRDFVLDFDTSALPLGTTVFDLEDNALSQELRLNSRLDDGYAKGSLNWSTGVYVAYQDTDVDFDLRGLGVARVTDIELFNAALFGFAEYAVTDRLRFGAGGRLDYLTTTGEQTFSTAMFSSTYGQDLDFLTFLPKATASFDLTDQATAYATLSRGYLPGGYNYNFANSEATFTFGEERSWTGEVGIRGAAFGGRFRYDAGAFYTDVRDKQITETVPGGIQRISNAARVAIYGAEATAEVDIVQNWSVRAGIGLQHAEAVDFQTAAGFPVPVPVDFSGNDLPLAPNLTYRFGLDYTHPSGFFAAASVQGSGRYYFDAANTLEQPDFAKLDASLGFRSDNLSIELTGKNLFDEATFTQSVATPRGQLVEDAPPRSFGIRLKAKL